MTKQAYTTRTGKTQYKVVLTEAQYHAADDSSTGWCLACGTEREGCEPDARRYPCENCGQEKAYGIPELMMMGLAVLKVKRQPRRHSDGSLLTRRSW